MTNIADQHGPSFPSMPEQGYLRLPQILEIFPVSKSSWWKGVADGKYPASVKLGERTTAWRVEDIRKLIERLSGDAA
jgi:prophage regulatory protein